MFEASKLCAAYGRRQVLQGVSFSLEKGTITALLGANGCGKTTLLRAICGIVPHEGSCVLEGTSLEGLPAGALARLVSYIPQRSGISIDLTALEVVLMGFNPWLPLLAQPTRQMQRQALEVLEQLQIPARENYLDLSEGQKQLCILARTMVTQSRLLLLDEPESALDLRNRYEVFRRLRHWMQDRAVLAALHDPQLALQTADRVLLLKDGKVDAVLHPKRDDLQTMEELLCRIYGAVRLHRIDGTVVMIKEEEMAWNL